MMYVKHHNHHNDPFQQITFGYPQIVNAERLLLLVIGREVVKAGDVRDDGVVWDMEDIHKRIRASELRQGLPMQIVDGDWHKERETITSAHDAAIADHELAVRITPTGYGLRVRIYVGSPLPGDSPITKDKTLDEIVGRASWLVHDLGDDTYINIQPN